MKSFTRHACYFVYHPETEHPYEYTKPLPKQELNNASILKVDSRNMLTSSPNLEQVQTLTRTPRRFWIPYPGRDKRDAYRESFNDNVDRPGLTS